jgi:hypothetical protein
MMPLIRQLAESLTVSDEALAKSDRYADLSLNAVRQLAIS